MYFLTVMTRMAKRNESLIVSLPDQEVPGNAAKIIEFMDIYKIKIKIKFKNIFIFFKLN